MLPQSVPCQTNALMCTLYCSYPMMWFLMLWLDGGKVNNSPANRKRCARSISNSQMRLAASQDLHTLSILHSQESVVQPTHVLTRQSLHLGKPQDRAASNSVRCSSLGQ
jgi:hypothetical protein